MVSAHPNAVETTVIRQPPKLGDFFTPYQQQSNQMMPSLIENGFDNQYNRQNSMTSQMRNGMMITRQNGRSPLANTTNNQFSNIGRPQPLLSNGIPSNQENPQRSSTAVPKNPKLYKTELCRSWMDHGRCNYGDRCQYAHGESEKRPIPRHPKYKTEACQSYHKTGYCPYGPRCHFIHNEEPAVLAQLIAQNAQAMATVVQQQQQQIAQRPRNLGLQQTMSAPASTVATPMQRGPGTPNSGVLPIGSRPMNNSRLFTQRPVGSDGESPAPSSTDSGSESPLGSFSPGLEYDETLCRLSPNSFHRSLSNSNNSTWGTGSSLVGIDFWQGTETPLITSFSGLNLDFDNEEKRPLSIWDSPSPPKTNSPTRLPVFERLSNNF